VRPAAADTGNDDPGDRDSGEYGNTWPHIGITIQKG
jgi:hypothetical protein